MTTKPASASLSVKTVLTDITIVLAGVATVGEGVLAALPSGPLHTAAAVALPILVAVTAAISKLLGS